MLPIEDQMLRERQKAKPLVIVRRSTKYERARFAVKHLLKTIKRKKK